ncbi:hypothetical protein [Sphingobium sp. CFD-1]|uniref:hypothetical protein n=1 Tax=Sphingobium sp. CFD-1 TaxID=2878545 RepID=UPI00214BAE85|nr:hypothetical protein [Sphingobium sp. CFD-1]
MDHPLFRGEVFSRRDAFQWMVAAACWRPMPFNVKGKVIDLQRGQFCASREQLAKEFQWSPSAVERFLTRLETEQMIGRETGQGKSIITICNYDKYQDVETEAGQKSEQSDGQKSDRNRTAKETRERNKEEREGAKAPRADDHYAFAGQVIRLNREHYQEWKARYHAIPDFDAELASLDAWYQAQADDKRRNWFFSVQGSLNRKHQETLKAGTGQKTRSQELQNVFDMADAAERRRLRWEQSQREQAERENLG